MNNIVFVPGIELSVSGTDSVPTLTQFCAPCPSKNYTQLYLATTQYKAEFLLTVS